MVPFPDPSSVKVYTVNGAPAGSSSSLPDWLTRKRAAKGKGKRAVREHYEGTIELIQGFEFPEASNRVKTTRDGHHVIATGTYKPQIRVWDLGQLSQKFERHTDAENVDFIILSDDWTKSMHLQNDRTIDLHTQSGFHYRTRIPRFGRALAYHFPSCDAFISAVGNEIYRLNLDQGRFLNPLVLEDDDNGEILGVNVIDVNPAHQLLALGVDGNGTVQFWDTRSRSSVGTLSLPHSRLLPTGTSPAVLPGVDISMHMLSVTAISSRSDGLSYAVGTSSGHTLLYDIRTTRPFALKDQGYSMPVKNVSWIEGGSRMVGDGLVLSADRKVIKIWDRNSPSANFTSITPATDINHVHHIPDSGLIMLANEGIQMTTYYVPQLGPAPRWASFLENITEEMEDQTTRSVYEDYKFVERNELQSLGLDHLVGTPALKPYMHGYFLSLKLYDTARVIANPFVYAEHREKMIRQKMEKMAETRIRTKLDAGVRVNKAMAEKIQKEKEREQRKVQRKSAKKVPEDAAADAMVVDEGEPEVERPNLLNDPRFKQLFEDPEFEVDETTREYALLNPSAVSQQRSREDRRVKTAVEEEEEESDKQSSDGLGSSNNSDNDEKTVSDDSSDAGELNPRSRRDIDTRAEGGRSRSRPQNRAPKVNLVPVRTGISSRRGYRSLDKDAPLGQRRMGNRNRSSGSAGFAGPGEDSREVTWVPASSKERSASVGRDAKKNKRRGVETFGAGMERGGEERTGEISEAERKGRTHRRQGVRSGSKNVFRRL